MYNNAITIKRIATKMKKIQAKKTSKDEELGELERDHEHLKA